MRRNLLRGSYCRDKIIQWNSQNAEKTTRTSKADYCIKQYSLQLRSFSKMGTSLKGKN